jgi:hypothetical protein
LRLETPRRSGTPPTAFPHLRSIQGDRKPRCVHSRAAKSNDYKYATQWPGALGFHAAPTVVHLADLKIEKTAEEGERCTIEADLGPVVALLLDPAAVLLLLAAASVRAALIGNHLSRRAGSPPAPFCYAAGQTRSPYRRVIDGLDSVGRAVGLRAA